MHVHDPIFRDGRMSSLSSTKLRLRHLYASPGSLRRMRRAVAAAFDGRMNEFIPNTPWFTEMQVSVNESSPAAAAFLTRCRLLLLAQIRR